MIVSDPGKGVNCMYVVTVHESVARIGRKSLPMFTSFQLKDNFYGTEVILSLWPWVDPLRPLTDRSASWTAICRFS